MRRAAKEKLYEAMGEAARWYARQLHEHPRRQAAVDELHRHGIEVPSDTVRVFRLGYAPSDRSGGRGFDRFQHRLMFPMVDGRGRVIGFRGRALPPIGACGPSILRPKYISSDESPIDSPRSSIFGLHQARTAIRQQGEAILVEAMFDVVTLHAHGLRNVVAIAANHFTAKHARRLQRYSPLVTTVFDRDAAGSRAERVVRARCERAGLPFRAASLPPRSDPDAYVRAHGADALRRLIDKA